MQRPPRNSAFSSAAAGALLVLLSACAATPASPASSTSPSARPSTSSRPPSSTTTSAGSPSSTSVPRPPDPVAACAASIVATMPTAHRVGQLIWVGLDVNAGRTSLDAVVADQHVGGVVLLGGWGDPTRAAATTAHLRGLVAARTTSGLGLFISADQEGGAVQQMRGAGFTTIPSALKQGSMRASALTAAAKSWAQELGRVGVNVNLAPVADTVPGGLGTGNGPIGRWGRQFSSDPRVNAAQVTAVVTGMHQGGLAATVKHFPGLGRVRNNTDFSATGITDTVTTADDAYLEPFASGIRAGADFVMVSSAYYPRLDRANQAVFSRAVITTLLRTTMGYDGVVVTDDVGNARSVSAVPTGQRATRFLASGGDIVLTASPSSVPTMTGDVLAKAAADPGFAALVDAAVTRVVELKVRRGLASCP